MEADFCLAKRLEMNQGMRLFARRPLLPRQGHHAFVNHQQFGDCARRTIQSPLDLTMLPEAADVSESRKLPKVHHSATRKSFDEVLDSLARTFSCRNPNRLINNFTFKFFSTGNTPNGRNSIFHTQLINLKNS